MKADKLDYKKEYKDLYLPPSKPVLIDVPMMNFIMVDGTGDPQGEEYQHALEILYALTFTIKMSKMNGTRPTGYYEYVVPPLEGLWWGKDGKFDINIRDEWLWTSMIRQPEFVTVEVFDRAVWECRKKKPELDVSKARFEPYTEGLAVQIMHIGPFRDEPVSLEKINQFIDANGLHDMTGNVRKHHEIYLSDPRRTAADKLKTVLRHPVKH
jgi:hypothetical protein